MDLKRILSSFPCFENTAFSSFTPAFSVTEMGRFPTKIVRSFCSSEEVRFCRRESLPSLPFGFMPFIVFSSSSEEVSDESSF